MVPHLLPPLHPWTLPSAHLAVQLADEVLLQAALHVVHHEVHERLGHAVLHDCQKEGVAVAVLVLHAQCYM